MYFKLCPKTTPIPILQEYKLAQLFQTKFSLKDQILKLMFFKDTSDLFYFRTSRNQLIPCVTTKRLRLYHLLRRILFESLEGEVFFCLNNVLDSNWKLLKTFILEILQNSR